VERSTTLCFEKHMKKEENLKKKIQKKIPKKKLPFFKNPPPFPAPPDS
jgi:hypothetical protein